MASLENKYIYETYKGLIKTEDNEPIDGTLKTLTDGEGNPLPIEVSDSVVRLTGNTVQTNVNIDGYGEVINSDGEWVGPGTSGTQGPQGPIGPQGSQGSIGVQGPIGPQGVAGANGAQGVQGPQGLIGTQGSIGAQGIQGPIGPQGVAGANGAQGDQGPIGAQGVQGPQGFQGAQGTNGISAGKLFYFNESQTSDVAGYKVLNDIPVIGVQQTVSTILTGSQQNALVQQFITPELGFTVIPAGIQRFKLYYTIEAANVEVNAYVTLELADSTGTGYGSIISASPVQIAYNSGLPTETDIDVVLPSFAINATDRMIVKLYLNNIDSTSRNVIWSTEDGYYSYVITSVGVTGNQGPQGPQGFQGIAGATGAQGAQGPQGLIGDQGAQGPQGEDSTVPGPQGPQGPQGSGATGGGSILPAYDTMTPWDFAFNAITYGSSWNLPFNTIADSFGTRQVPENTIWFVPITVTDGTVINDIMVEVTGGKAVNQGTVIAIYDSIIVGNKLRINEALFSGAFDATTTGVKIITGINTTLSGSPESIYWLAICNLDSTASAGFSVRIQTNNNFGGQYVASKKWVYPTTPTSLATLYRKGNFLISGGYGGDPDFNLVLPTPYDYTNNPVIRGSDAQNDVSGIPLIFWK